MANNIRSSYTVRIRWQNKKMAKGYGAQLVAYRTGAALPVQRDLKHTPFSEPAEALRYATIVRKRHQHFIQLWQEQDNA